MAGGFLKYFYVGLIGLMLGSESAAQIQPLSINTADSLMAKVKKPMLLLISTEWCKFCYLQKQQLSKHDNLQAYRQNFYFFELNAEQQTNILFQGKNYRYKSKGKENGIHELAIALNGSERLTFPTWVVLDGNYKRVFRHSGLLLTKEVEHLVELVRKMDAASRR